MSFWVELRRRNVFRVGIAYLAAVWLLLQVADTVLPTFSTPAWVMQVLVFASFLGFPFVLVLAWFYELTPEGIKVASEMEAAQTVKFTGRKLDFAIIGLLVLAVAFLAVDTNVLNQQGSLLPNSVAVLPFENLSPDPDDAYFSAGIHEEIVNQLAKLSALNVIARASVMSYANADISIPEIAAELNVETVMEGSVRYADGRVLVTAQLIDPKTNSQMWSDSYNREFSGIFDIQADIAMHIANALAVEFSLEELRAIERPPTDSAEAYALYLRALEFMAVDGAVAIDFLNQALGFDSDFARAHYLLAWLHSEYTVNTLGSNAVSEDERKRHAQLASVHAARAAELDPAFEASWIGITPKILSWHWSEALTELSAAPDPMEQAGVWLYSYVDEHETAIARGRRGVDLNPKQWSQIWTLAAALAYAGEYNEAEQVQRAAIAEAPALPVLHLWLAYMDIALGNDEDALNALDRAERLMGRNRQIVMLPELAYAYSRVGLTDDARRIFDELELAAGELDIGAGGWTMAYLAVDENDRAVEQLETATNRIDNYEADQGFWNLMNIKMNITADPMLEKPEFVALRNRLRGD